MFMLRDEAIKYRAVYNIKQVHLLSLHSTIGVYPPHPTLVRGPFAATLHWGPVLSHGTLPHIICIVDGAKGALGTLGCSAPWSLLSLWVIESCSERRILQGVRTTEPGS